MRTDLNEQLGTGSGTIPIATLHVLLGTTVAWLLLTLVAAGASQNLLFDGAMNLEVSRSLAEGHGPQRLYDFGTLFAHGVQTKEPYLLLGALVFKVLGVGPVQAQLPNLIYLFLFCTVLLFAVGRHAGKATALIAAILALSTPQITQYGLNGYGEIPCFVFGLASLVLVSTPNLVPRGLLVRCGLAGLLAGLAVATKTVALIQVGAVGLVILIRTLSESTAPIRDTARGCAIFLAGVAMPLLLIEVWRWSWLGTESYGQWWDYQITRILYQAGVSNPTPTAPVPLLPKVAEHFGILASKLGRGRWTTACLLVLPLVATAITIRRDSVCRWFVVGLFAIFACYVIWWMAITPTEKAWLRRIYIGLICLSTIAAIAIGGSIKALTQSRSMQSKLLYAALSAGLISIYLPFVVDAVARPVSFKPDPGVVHTLKAARFVAGLEPDTLVFAYGWYSAPTVALHSGRSFIDLTDWPFGDATGRPAYLVADRATFITGMLDRPLARYPNQPMLSENIHAQVYKVDFSRPVDPFSPEQYAHAVGHVDFVKNDYDATYGMEPLDPGLGGRFIESDSEILLQYDGEDQFVMRAYVSLPHYYRQDERLSGRIVIEGCKAIPLSFVENGWQEFILPIECPIRTGAIRRVRLLLDNVFDKPKMYDRQRALLLAEIGFKADGID